MHKQKNSNELKKKIILYYKSILEDTKVRIKTKIETKIV